MSNSIYQQTERNLAALKMHQMKIHLEEVANTVGNDNLSFTEGLLKLTNYELDFKENSAAQNTIHAAAFPFIKTLADFDFNFQPSVSERQMQEFCSLGFMERKENIVFLGSSGVGKTHLATAIGISAAQHHNIIRRTRENEVLENMHYKCENEMNQKFANQPDEQQQKTNLINSLEESGSFSQTHKIIEQMLHTFPGRQLLCHLFP